MDPDLSRALSNALYLHIAYHRRRRLYREIWRSRRGDSHRAPGMRMPKSYRCRCNDIVMSGRSRTARARSACQRAKRACSDEWRDAGRPGRKVYSVVLGVRAMTPRRTLQISCKPEPKPGENDGDGRAGAGARGARGAPRARTALHSCDVLAQRPSFFRNCAIAAAASFSFAL